MESNPILAEVRPSLAEPSPHFVDQGPEPRPHLMRFAGISGGHFNSAFRLTRTTLDAERHIMPCLTRTSRQPPKASEVKRRLHGLRRTREPRRAPHELPMRFGARLRSGAAMGCGALHALRLRQPHAAVVNERSGDMICSSAGRNHHSIGRQQSASGGPGRTIADASPRLADTDSATELLCLS